MIDPNYMIFNIAAKDHADECMKSFYSIDEELFDFQNYISDHSTTFTDMFERVYFKSICQELEAKNENLSDCKTIINGNLDNVSILNWLELA